MINICSNILVVVFCDVKPFIEITKLWCKNQIILGGRFLLNYLEPNEEDRLLDVFSCHRTYRAANKTLATRRETCGLKWSMLLLAHWSWGGQHLWCWKLRVNHHPKIRMLQSSLKSRVFPVPALPDICITAVRAVFGSNEWLKDVLSDHHLGAVDNAQGRRLGKWMGIQQ